MQANLVAAAALFVAMSVVANAQVIEVVLAEEEAAEGGVAGPDFTCGAGVGCQLPDLVSALRSDLNPALPIRFADNFHAPVGGTVTSVCWWGVYSVTGGDCGPGTGDAFQIFYYTDGPGSSGPATIKAGPFPVTPSSKAVVATVQGLDFWQFEATHPPVALDPGERYWIEITNRTTGSCIWFWATSDTGDDLVFALLPGNPYSPWGSPADLAFCLDIPIEAELGACCLHDGQCSELVEDECVAQGGDFLGVGTTCDPNPCPRSHPGWNWVDNLIKLTKNEPCYWSALTGQPKGLSPFTVLDPPPPGGLPGRPATDGSTDRVLRGYVIAYATDVNGNEIRWNHLKGDATIVNYASSTAWEYNAYSFPVVAPVSNGAATGTPGDLHLDGVEYAEGFDLLLMDFYAPGSRAFGDTSVLDTDLTLLPISVDLRQETDGPITTKAHFDVWNEYEVKFSGAYRCITCWDQWLLSRHGVPNHFAYSNLQTDKGKARIDGLASHLCDYDNDPKDQKALGEDPNDIVSVDASLLGVVAKQVYFGVPAVAANGGPFSSAAAGTNLHGMGTQPGVVRVDTFGPPDEALAPVASGRDDVIDPVTELVRLAGLSAVAPQSTRDAGGVAGTVSGSRVGASDKGSLIIFPKVEIRWDQTGNLLQDTFLDLSNDYPADVQVQLYFINGDAPVSAKQDGKEEDDFVKDPLF